MHWSLHTSVLIKVILGRSVHQLLIRNRLDYGPTDISTDINKAIYPSLLQTGIKQLVSLNLFLSYISSVHDENVGFKNTFFNRTYPNKLNIKYIVYSFKIKIMRKDYICIVQTIMENKRHPLIIEVQIKSQPQTLILT